MLAYLLALIVGLSSVGLYMAAFFFPEVHRKNDFIWSGLGLFYALVLWVCAGRITGGVLLGQTASVTLLGWLGWQTLTLRRQLAPVDQQTAVPTAAEWQQSLLEALTKAWDGLSRSPSIAPLLKPMSKQVARLTAWLEALVTTTTKPTSAPPPGAEAKPYVPLTPADFANAKRDADDSSNTIAAAVTPIQTDDRSSPKESPLSAIASSFKGLTAKRESKPVYVRKQFRAPEAASQTSDAEATSQTTVVTTANTQAIEQPDAKNIAVESQSEAAMIDSVEAAIVEAAIGDAEITDTSQAIPDAENVSPAEPTA